jgi:hypothetical protein
MFVIMFIHAVASQTGRTAPIHSGRGDELHGRGDTGAGSNVTDHHACLEKIRELREENDILRKSADEFAALAERLQRALTLERAKTAREGAAGGPGDRTDANHVLTIAMQIEAEFRAIPNLRVTRWQAARLWDLDQNECDEAIAALVRNRVLRETPGGFVRREK